MCLNQGVLLVKNQKTFPAANQDFMAMILAIVLNVLQINLQVLSLDPTPTANVRTHLLINALLAKTHAALTTVRAECACRINAQVVSFAKSRINKQLVFRNY